MPPVRDERSAGIDSIEEVEDLERRIRAQNVWFRRIAVSVAFGLASWVAPVMGWKGHERTEGFSFGTAVYGLVLVSVFGCFVAIPAVTIGAGLGLLTYVRTGLARRPRRAAAIAATVLALEFALAFVVTHPRKFCDVI